MTFTIQNVQRDSAAITNAQGFDVAQIVMIDSDDPNHQLDQTQWAELITTIETAEAKLNAIDGLIGTCLEDENLTYEKPIRDILDLNNSGSVETFKFEVTIRFTEVNIDRKQIDIVTVYAPGYAEAERKGLAMFRDLTPTHDDADVVGIYHSTRS